MGSLDRRKLFYENDSDYDPNLVLNVNEFLIKEWPQLSAKARKSVWITCQNDSEWDWSDIEGQIDEHVFAYAATDPQLADLPEFQSQDTDDEEDIDDDVDIEADDDDHLFMFDVKDYLSEYWPTLTEEQAQHFQEMIVFGEATQDAFMQTVDDIIFAAAEEDDSIELPEYDEEDEEDEE